MVKRQDSVLTFGKLILDSERQELMNILGIFNEGGASKYLGLPECFSGSKVKLLSYLKDRTHVRLDSWFLRKLSMGGKEVLLKTTASALPVYAMSCFRLPKTVTRSLVSMMSNYWWSSQPHLKKIH